jgi:hypothetical protein
LVVKVWPWVFQQLLTNRSRTETKGGSVSFVFLCALGGKGLALGLPKIARQA